MKQKDIALIIVIAAVAAMISFLSSRALFQSGGNRQQQAEVVDVISTEFTLPDEKYFNENSINPTQQIKIGDNTNPNPFNGPAQ